MKRQSLHARRPKPKSTWKQKKRHTLNGVTEGRRKLIEQLGGKCLQCSAVEKLEFHHLRPRTWVAAQLNRWQRLAEYKREAARGEIVLLCKPCNQRAGKPAPDYTPEPDFEPEF